jgi:hypothetical protein
VGSTNSRVCRASGKCLPCRCEPRTPFTRQALRSRLWPTREGYFSKPIFLSNALNRASKRNGSRSGSTFQYIT